MLELRPALRSPASLATALLNADTHFNQVCCTPGADERGFGAAESRYIAARDAMRAELRRILAVSDRELDALAGAL